MSPTPDHATVGTEYRGAGTADWLSGWIDWFINLSTTWPLWGKVLVVFGVLAGLAGGIGALISFWDWTFGGAIKRKRDRKREVERKAEQAKRDAELRNTREAAESAKFDTSQTLQVVLAMKAQLDKQSVQDQVVSSQRVAISPSEIAPDCFEENITVGSAFLDRGNLEAASVMFQAARRISEYKLAT